MLQFFDARDGAADFTVRPLFYSLASKVSGRLDRSLCDRIRCFDTREHAEGASLSCDTAIDTTGRGVILRGSYLCRRGGKPLTVKAFDVYGQEVGLDFVVLGEDSEHEDTAFVRMTRRCYYSIRVGKLDHNVCLSLFNEDGELVDPPLVLVKWRRKELVDEMRARCVTSFDQNGYENWLFSHRITAEQAREQSMQRIGIAPKFSIIVPLYKTPRMFFIEMADSVINQTYKNWELILVNASPDVTELVELVEEYATKDSRIKVVSLSQNLGITENTNHGIKVATGDYLCFFDHDDVLEPDILFEYASAIDKNRDISLLYCDEDKIFFDGHYGNPTFKPDFSIDMLRDNNYICHLLTVKRSELNRIEPSGPELDGAQDHAMVLKIVELGGRVHHVPRVLYHWRMSESSTAANSDSKPYATEAGIRAVKDHLGRVGLSADVECSHGRAFRYLPTYHVLGNPLVTIVVPTRLDSTMCKSFISMIESTSYSNVEVVFVCPEARLTISDPFGQWLSSGVPVRCVGMDTPFSISSWMNAGAKYAAGDVLLFCHDDVRCESPNWVEIMLGHALRSDVGIVGTMTLSEDNIVQQAGITFVDGEFVNLSAGIYKDSPGYIMYPLTTKNVSVVDGSCMMMRRDVFDEVDGFDEGFVESFSNADICFRVSNRGYGIVYTPEVAMYHRSVTSLGAVGVVRKTPQYYRDKARMYSLWADLLSRGDKYFNRNFSRNPIDAASYRFDNAPSQAQCVV